MVVVMAPDATEEDVARVVARVEEVGGEAFVSQGVVRTIIGLVGDVDSFHHLNLRSMRGVADVHRISDPFKLVSRQHHPERSTVWVGPPGRQVPIGPDTFTVLAGPCAVESPEQTLEAARMAQAAGATMLRGGAFKPRTSPYAFAGLGLRRHRDPRRRRRRHRHARGERGRRPPRRRRSSPSTSTCSRSAPATWPTPALLHAVGDCRAAGAARARDEATVEEWLMAAEHVAQRGNLEIVLCERGIRTFETADPPHPGPVRGAGGPGRQPPARGRRPLPRRGPQGPRGAAGARRDRRRRRRDRRRRPPRPGDRALRGPAGPARHRPARPRPGGAAAAAGPSGASRPRPGSADLLAARP